MCFWMMHILSKFQFFIHISAELKLKNKKQSFEKWEKKGPVFATFSALHSSMN